MLPLRDVVKTITNCDFYKLSALRNVVKEQTHMLPMDPQGIAVVSGYFEVKIGRCKWFVS